jgi:uncharacterized protein DUF4382
MFTRRLACLALALPAAFFIFGCDQSNSSQTGTAMGTVSVRMIDAPLDLFTVQSVNVTLTGVTIYPEETINPLGMVTETGAISLMTHPATFDLLTLTAGASALLASGEVPAGNYDRIRLEISDATLVFKNGTSQRLSIESSKVDIPIQFQVTVSADTILTIDFDAAASVQVNDTGLGTYILRPVVTPVS